LIELILGRTFIPASVTSLSCLRNIVQARNQSQFLAGDFFWGEGKDTNLGAGPACLICWLYHNIRECVYAD